MRLLRRSGRTASAQPDLDYISCSCSESCQFWMCCFKQLPVLTAHCAHARWRVAATVASSKVLVAFGHTASEDKPVVG
jgi:hypothetical protein